MVCRAYTIVYRNVSWSVVVFRDLSYRGVYKNVFCFSFMYLFHSIPHSSKLTQQQSDDVTDPTTGNTKNIKCLKLTVIHRYVNVLITNLFYNCHSLPDTTLFFSNLICPR